jgi:hypothetical protein
LYTPQVTVPTKHRTRGLLVGSVLVLSACTGGDFEPGSDAEAEGPPRVAGVLFVERAQGGSAAEAQVGARFLRVVGLPDAVLPDLVGMPVLPPRPGQCLERGNRAAQLATENPRAEVRLLDVGPIDVRAGDQALRMDPHRFPDLWNVVSGVLYGLEGDLPLATWRFSAQGDGAAGVGSFEVEAPAPEDLAQVRAGDAALADAAGAPVTLVRHAPLAVRWARGADEDRVAIAFEGSGTVVCGARDDGAFDVDAATVDRIAELLHAGGTMSVHRVRTRPFTAPGLDAGTLVFDLSVRARVRAD